MSGHSKWATIHRDKEVNDSKKGAAFTKLAHAITIAARQKEEYKLRLIIEKARSLNMPKENIARAIERAIGSQGVSLEEVLFEGFVPGGIGVMVECLTDNKLRTAQEIRMILEKSGGTMGSAGTIAYLFDHLGEIKVQKKSGVDNDSQMLAIIDLGAEDITSEADLWDIYCHKDKMHSIKVGLETAGYQIESLSLIYRAFATIPITDQELRSRIEIILGKLDDLDDVTQIWTNYN